MTIDTETHPHPQATRIEPIHPPTELSAAERAMLDGLSERMRPLAYEAHRLICDRAAIEGGLIVRVIRGSATTADQLAIWAVGRQLIDGRDPLLKASWRVTDPGLVRTRAFPGSSAHQGPDGNVRQGGDAVDIALLDARSGAWLRGGSPARADPRWDIVREAADILRLEWGGRFKVRDARGVLQPFFDGAHLQHPLWRR